MDHSAVVDALRILLAREELALAPRLFESTVFVSRLSVRSYVPAQRLATTNREHRALLTDLIVDLGGMPIPRSCDAATADMHYQELSYALPRLVKDHDALIEQYRRAGAVVGSNPRAARLISQILSRHEKELAELKELLDRKRAPA